VSSALIAEERAVPLALLSKRMRSFTVAEKATILECGCDPVRPWHNFKDGRVERLPNAPVQIALYEGSAFLGLCTPNLARHTHSADCYANASACMQQPFGTSTRINL
jgi:hypothetical protein